MLATTDNTRKRQRSEAEGASAEEAAKWFTRPGLAAALRVSLSTVDRMLANDELPCMRLRGRVRFHLPDVIERLRKGNRKYGRRAALTGNPKSDQPKSDGNQDSETRNPKGVA